MPKMFGNIDPISDVFDQEMEEYPDEVEEEVKLDISYELSEYADGNNTNIFMLDLILFVFGIILVFLTINMLYYRGAVQGKWKRRLLLIFVIVAPIVGTVCVSSSVAEISRIQLALDGATWVPLFVSGVVMSLVGAINLHKFHRNGKTSSNGENDQEEGDEESDLEEERPYTFVFRFKFLRSHLWVKFLLSGISGLINVGYYWLANYAGDLNAFGACFGAILSAGFDSILGLDDIVVFGLTLVAFIIQIIAYDGSKSKFFVAGLLMTIGTAIFQNSIVITDRIIGFPMGSTVRNGVTAVFAFFGMIANKEIGHLSKSDIDGGIMQSFLDFTIFPIVTQFMSNLTANLFIFGTAFLVVNFDETREKLEESGEYDPDKEEGTVAKYIPSALIIISQIVRIIVNSRVKQDMPPIYKRCGYINRRKKTDPPMLLFCIHLYIMNRWNQKIFCIKGIYLMKILASVIWLAMCIIIGVSKDFSISGTLRESFYPPDQLTSNSDPDDPTYVTTMFVIFIICIVVLAAAAALLIPLCRHRQHKYGEVGVEISCYKMKFYMVSFGVQIVLGILAILCFIYLIKENGDKFSYFSPHVTMLLIFFVLTIVNYSFATNCGRIAGDIIEALAAGKLNELYKNQTGGEEEEEEEEQNEGEKDDAIYEGQNAIEVIPEKGMDGVYQQEVV